MSRSTSNLSSRHSFQWAFSTAASPQQMARDPPICRAVSMGWASMLSRSTLMWFAALIIAVGTLPAPASCNFCHIRFQHRVGNFRIALSSTRSEYVIGSKYYVKITITNGHHSPPLRVDPAAVASSFSLTVKAPTYSAAQGDQSPSSRGTTVVPAGGNFSFPVKALQIWPNFLGYRAGQYEASVAYDHVDSNIIKFRVVPR
jgi:hypothetical protein